MAKEETKKKKTTTKKPTSTSKKTTKKKETAKKTPTTKKTTSKKETTKKVVEKKTTKKPVVKKEGKTKEPVEKKKEKKKKTFSIYQFFLPILLGTFILSLMSFQISNTTEPKMVVKTEKKVEETVIIKDGYDIDKIQSEYKNSDIIGYLDIPGVMGLPIVRTNDNVYYLTHRLDHSTNIRGTPFMDYRVKFEDKKILIYGHSGPEDDLPFMLLHKYDDLEFYKEHPTMYLYSKTKKYTYEIFSVYMEKNDFDYVNIKTFRGLTWKEHVEKLKNKSRYTIPVEITEESKILILQTCRVEGTQQGGQYKLVIGLLTKEEANRY